MAESSNARESQWYFSAEQLQNSPSRKCGIDADKELQYRQQTAYLIQEMGQHLRVSQLCINTAIVYMHRFYAFHSFTHFHRNGIAAASLFLAAKVEEQPRKLEHVIRVVNASLNEDITKEAFLEQAQDLVFNENVLLQTLGFDVAIDHPHTHVVKTCHLVKAGKDLAQTSYFMASNSLHLTTMCLQYKPTVVACFCIHLACKWSSWEIPNSTEGRPWFHYVDKTVTTDLLSQLTEEFIQIYQKSPSRLKNKLNSIKALVQGTRPEDQQQQQQQKSGSSANGAGSGSSSSGGGHRSGSAGGSSGGGGHHHHHHHHHHSKGAPIPGQVQSNSSLAAATAQGDKSKQSTSYNQSRSGSGSSSNKHSNQSMPPQQQAPGAQPSHRQQQQQQGPLQHGNGSRPSNAPDAYKSRPPGPPQQQQSASAAAMSGKNNSSSNNNNNLQQQKYNPPPPPPYSAENSMSSLGGGSKSNSPVQGSRSGPQGKQPLFMGNYGDSKKSLISEDAFQFSIDDLRDAQDSQDSNQMAPKGQKVQSIFCPDWKEDYTSGNTEHAKMNLPIGSTGDTKAPLSMMAGHGQQQQQRMMQKQQGQSSSSSSSSSSMSSSGMRKPEKKPDQQQPQHRIHQFGGIGANPGNNSSSIGSGSGVPSSNPGTGMSRQHHGAPPQTSISKQPNSSSSSSSSSKRPYDEMMGGGGEGGVGGASEMSQNLMPDYRDAKLRRSEMQGGDLGYDMQQQRQRPLEKDFNDYRDSSKSLSSSSSSATSSAPISTTTTAAASAPPSSSTTTSKYGYGNSAHSIETNPDLVSSLLKESLSNTEHTKPFTTLPVGGGGGAGSAAMTSQGPPPPTMTSSSSSTVSTSQLDELINGPPQPFQQMRNVNGVGGGGEQSLQMDQRDEVAMGGQAGGEEYHRHKSEKKKKKEKHKNKDKEKDRGSRDERKKHKKDKERHKERHHHHHHEGEVLEPLKLKIPRMEPGTAGDEAMGGSLKLKIPRNPEPMVSLKIKIPKDKIINREAEEMDSAAGGGGLGGGMDGGYHKKKDKEKVVKREY